MSKVSVSAAGQVIRPRLLLVDGAGTGGDLLGDLLSERGFRVVATSADAALEAVGAQAFDAALCELELRDDYDVPLCQRLAEVEPNLPILVTAAQGDVAQAIAAIRAGAYDFLPRPLEPEAVVLALERALRHRTLREEVRRLRSRLEGGVGEFEEIVGESAPIQALCALIDRVARTDASVLVVGETGAGKELIARALHRRSPRAQGPWVAVNCAALPEPLLESELFGHAAGAFTGARGPRGGLMQQAHGGTLFLDEIGEMPLSLQVKLLRALQERAVRPVGSDREVEIDIRLVSATNAELEEAVAEGRFREELLYRIQVVRVDAPPLRGRGNDVLLLAQRFLVDFARRNGKRVVGLSSSFAERILAYDWPGNVRELRNCIERAVALTDHEQLVIDDLPPKIREFHDSSHLIDASDVAQFAPLEQVERHYILRVLEAVGGNKARAARILGLNRKTLYRRLEQYTADSGRLPRSSDSGSFPASRARPGSGAFRRLPR